MRDVFIYNSRLCFWSKIKKPTFSLYQIVFSYPIKLSLSSYALASFNIKENGDGLKAFHPSPPPSSSTLCYLCSIGATHSRHS